MVSDWNLPPQVPTVSDTRPVILYDHRGHPLTHPVGFKGAK